MDEPKGIVDRIFVMQFPVKAVATPSSKPRKSTHQTKRDRLVQEAQERDSERLQNNDLGNLERPLDNSMEDSDVESDSESISQRHNSINGDYEDDDLDSDRPFASPEDILCSLHTPTFFPDDTRNQHGTGDVGCNIVYTSSFPVVSRVPFDKFRWPNEQDEQVQTSTSNFDEPNAEEEAESPDTSDVFYDCHEYLEYQPTAQLPSLPMEKRETWMTVTEAPSNPEEWDLFASNVWNAGVWGSELIGRYALRQHLNELSVANDWLANGEAEADEDANIFFDARESHDNRPPGGSSAKSGGQLTTASSQRGAEGFEGPWWGVPKGFEFDVGQPGSRVLELGAGLALTSITAALVGSPDSEVVISDYPKASLLVNIQKNVERNVPLHVRERVHVVGHKWGEFPWEEEVAADEPVREAAIDKEPPQREEEWVSAPSSPQLSGNLHLTEEAWDGTFDLSLVEEHQGSNTLSAEYHAAPLPEVAGSHPESSPRTSSPTSTSTPASWPSTNPTSPPSVASDHKVEASAPCLTTGSETVECHRLDLNDSAQVLKPHSFTGVLAMDTLWLTNQHLPLARSISHYLAPRGKALVIAGFHTGRPRVESFFEVVEDVELAVEWIGEVNTEGIWRQWRLGREDDVMERKRWCVVALLKRAA